MVSKNHVFSDCLLLRVSISDWFLENNSDWILTTLVMFDWSFHILVISVWLMETILINDEKFFYSLFLGFIKIKVQ